MKNSNFTIMIFLYSEQKLSHFDFIFLLPLHEMINNHILIYDMLRLHNLECNMVILTFEIHFPTELLKTKRANWQIYSHTTNK